MSDSILTKSRNSESSTSYIFANDSYVILAFFALIISAIAGTIIAESSIPLMRTQFVNNNSAIVLTIVTLAIAYYFSGKRIGIMGYSLKAGYVAYPVIICVLVFLFSG